MDKTMNLLDLAKATVVCGGLAFLIYSFPLISQLGLISVLSFMWLVYAYKAISGLWRH